MIKIRFEEPRDPKNYPKTNIYFTVYGVLPCWAFYLPDTNEIIIVRQHHLLRTAYLLLHELGHWMIHIIFGKNEKKEDRIAKRYDDIDRKLTAKYFNIPLLPEKRKEFERNRKNK